MYAVMSYHLPFLYKKWTNFPSNFSPRITFGTTGRFLLRLNRETFVKDNNKSFFFSPFLMVRNFKARFSAMVKIDVQEKWKLYK